MAKVESGNHRISVSQGMSGYYAVHLADFEDMGWLTDIVQTGIGRYPTYEEAATEARWWAESEGLPLEIDDEQL